MTVLRAWKKDLSFTAGIVGKKPFQVLVQLTNKCNMRCSFCDFWPNVAPRSEELSVSDYKRLSRELKELGTFLVSIEGGEPLVRPDLVPIVEALSEHHVTALFTNGWLLTRELARSLFDAGLVHANVSIDYPDAERHDRKRGLDGAFARAWTAVDHFRFAAPRGGKQTHVMSVVMDDNWRDLPQLFEMSAARSVGHQLTLLSVNGYRRKSTDEGPDRLPPPEAGRALVEWHAKFQHIRMFREYFSRSFDWLDGRAMPECAAGVQSFNVDHVGAVSACIERIDESVGAVKTAPLRDLVAALAARQSERAQCQRCWTACRGFAQSLSGGASARTLLEMTARMRTT
jgi:MoaA/NifB/PqqE/SkfB family radical SAM enzyme